MPLPRHARRGLIFSPVGRTSGNGTTRCLKACARKVSAHASNAHAATSAAGGAGTSVGRAATMEHVL
jgi:hypothetical protein